MNSQQSAMQPLSRQTSLFPRLKFISFTKLMGTRHFLVLIRVMTSIFIIGLVGYTFDRLMQSMLQRPS